MSKASKNVIIVSIVVLLVALLTVYTIIKNSTSKIPDNTIGNTAGNLYNQGLYAEIDGRVYFSNVYDSGKLYSMKIDQTDVKKLSDLSAKYINVGGKYVFFFGRNTASSTGFSSVLKKPALIMLDQKGTTTTTLSSDATQSMILVGNKLYYQHYTEKEGPTFQIVNVNNKKKEKLLDYLINPSCYYNGSIYYNGLYDNHYLYSYNTANGLVSQIWTGDIWNPIYDGDYFYYMDIRNNYRLCRYSAVDNTIEVLTDERLDFYNLYGNIIYYQVSSAKNPRLMRMNKDGSHQETVLEGVFSDVSCTSTYTYFSTFDSGYPVYCTPTNGDIYVKEFKPGVAKNK